MVKLPSIEELLNEESNDITSLSNTEIEYAEIDPDTRIIILPERFQRLSGVESDANVERIRFRCPRIVGDNVDLSKYGIMVNYINANGGMGSYVVSDLKIDGENVTFSWLIGPGTLLYRGIIRFIVCAVYTEDGEVRNRWNTTIARSEVLEGIVIDYEMTVDEITLAEQLIAQASQKITELTLAMEDVEELRNNAQNALSDANTAVQNANTAVSNANDAIQDVETALGQIDEKLDSFIDDSAPSTNSAYSSSKVETLLDNLEEAIGNDITEEVNGIINDSTESNTKTYSSDKIEDLLDGIEQQISGIEGGGFSVIRVSSGDVMDIVTSGYYLLLSAVTGKPTTPGGNNSYSALLLVRNDGNGNIRYDMDVFTTSAYSLHYYRQKTSSNDSGWKLEQQIYYQLDTTFYKDIEDSTSIDDYREIGTYVLDSSSRIENISDLPFGVNKAFKLIVEGMAQSWIKQTLKEYDSTDVYERSMTNTGGTKTDWKKICGSIQDFMSITELGLSAPCETIDICEAMPSYSRIFLGTTSSNITDIPVTPAVLIITKYSNNRYDIECTISTTPPTSGDPIKYNGRIDSTGNSVTWERYVTEGMLEIVTGVAVFDSVADMVADTSLTVGMLVKTSNYYSDADGGGASYVIEQGSSPNGFTEIGLSNGLQARLLDYPTIMKIGGKPGTDIWDQLNFLTENLYKNIFFERGSYYLSDVIYYHSHMTFDFNHSSISYTGSKNIGAMFSNAPDETVTEVVIKNGLLSGTGNTYRNPFIYIYIRDRTTEIVQRVIIDNMIFQNNIGSGVRIATNYDWDTSGTEGGTATQWRNRMGHIIVKNCYATNVSCGFSALNARKVSFINNRSMNSKAEGLLFDVQCSQCIAIGNSIESPQGGVGCFGCDSPDICIFMGNICVNPEYYHIRVNTIRNTPGIGISIVGNMFYSPPAHSGYEYAIEFSNVTGIEGVSPDGRGTPAVITGNSFKNGITKSVHCELECEILYEGNQGPLPDINYSIAKNAKKINQLHFNVSSTQFQSETRIAITVDSADSERVTVSNNMINLNGNQCRICGDIKLNATPSSAVTLRMYNASNTALRSWVITERNFWFEVPMIEQEGIYFTVECASQLTVASNSEIYAVM